MKKIIPEFCYGSFCYFSLECDDSNRVRLSIVDFFNINLLFTKKLTTQLNSFSFSILTIQKFTGDKCERNANRDFRKKGSYCDEKDRMTDL